MIERTVGKCPICGTAILLGPNGHFYPDEVSGGTHSEQACRDAVISNAKCAVCGIKGSDAKEMA